MTHTSEEIKRAMDWLEGLIPYSHYEKGRNAAVIRGVVREAVDIIEVARECPRYLLTEAIRYFLSEGEKEVAEETVLRATAFLALFDEAQEESDDTFG